jgi:uncharacterized protein (TIGR01244 family)
MPRVDPLPLSERSSRIDARVPTQPVSPVARTDRDKESPMANETQPMPVLRTPRPGLCSSGQPGSSAWSPLARAGVRTVVNLRPVAELEGRDEQAEVRKAGLDYVHVPIADGDDLTRDAAETLHRVLLSSPPTVLVHCGTANRAGALIALADAWFGSRNFENALSLGRDAGMTALEPTVRAILAVGPR